MCDQCLAGMLKAGTKVQYAGSHILSKNKKTVTQNNILNEIMLFDWSYRPFESAFEHDLRLAYEVPRLLKLWQKRLLEDFTNPSKIKNDNLRTSRKT